MSLRHLPEIMDQTWPPASLHATLREILECGNSRPFRPYYQWVADEVARLAIDGEYQNIVELGAGTAPISRLLAEDSRLTGVRLIVSDDHPDPATYEDLERQYSGKIVAEKEPVDFSKPHAWPPRTLLVLSGTFHHVHPDARPQVLASLTDSGAKVMVCEPLRKTPVSMFFVLFSVFPALLLPLWFFRRPGKLRRFFWCWLFPIAPVIFWWDGLASCLRMWTGRQWRTHLQERLGPNREPTIKQSLFCQMVLW